jgi:hypothetical protein
MLHPARRFSTRPHGLRRRLLLASWISIAGGLFAASAADAATSAWLAADMRQAASDSVSSSQGQRPGLPASALSPMPGAGSPATTFQPAASNPGTQSAAPFTPKGPKPKANSLHLYGGLFVPIDVNAPSPTIGMRLGRRLGAHLQFGLLVDWIYERKNLEQPLNTLPGLQPNLILARADGQLVPAMLFFEVSLTEKRFLVPYGGIAAGYEWLMLKASDYRTDQSASATYSNIAWQGWGGLGIRLDPGLRVDVELNYNGGSLERDSPTSSGLREAVLVNGVGARVGLDISY